MYGVPEHLFSSSKRLLWIQWWTCLRWMTSSCAFANSHNNDILLPSVFGILLSLVLYHTAFATPMRRCNKDSKQMIFIIYILYCGLSPVLKATLCAICITVRQPNPDIDMLTCEHAQSRDLTRWLRLAPRSTRGYNWSKQFLRRLGPVCVVGVAVEAMCV